jgi:hypothetical protein
MLMWQGLEPEARTFNTIIIACNMCGQPQEALRVGALYFTFNGRLCMCFCIQNPQHLQIYLRDTVDNLRIYWSFM